MNTAEGREDALSAVVGRFTLAQFFQKEHANSAFD